MRSDRCSCNGREEDGCDKKKRTEHDQSPREKRKEEGDEMIRETRGDRNWKR